MRRFGRTVQASVKPGSFRSMKPRIVHPDPAVEFETDERCHILESWNVPEDREVSIARARVAPGVRTQLHRLGETVERYLMISGEGEVEVGELPPERVGPGDVVALNGGAGIYVAGLADSLEAGVDKARETIASGAARERLEALVALSQSLGAA